MFDFFDLIGFGRKITYEGKEYMALKELPSGYVMVAEIGANIPAPVYVIKDPEYKEPQKEEPKEEQA